MSGAWYDLTPAAYAKGLRYHAERSAEIAAGQAVEGGKWWKSREVERWTRQARRLRAMAALCDRSTAARAGDVDFLGMQCPSQPREAEDAAILEAEGRP